MNTDTLDIIADEAIIAAQAGTDKLKAAIALEALEQLMPNEETFEKFFKAKNTDAVALGAGLWGYEPTKNNFGMVTPEGSIITLRFYDAVKKIYDVKNQEVPGRESFIAYVEVTVRPAGKKPYLFKAFQSQQVWANGHITSKAKHDVAKEKLVERFTPLGFTVGADQWDTRFDRMTG